MTQDKNQLFAHLSHRTSFVLMDSDVPFVNWQVCFQHHCECVSVCVCVGVPACVTCAWMQARL